ncbi:sperm flagellar protein 2 isoform X2 [Corythoichthys intestinalis]|uniref:sperm flagellar protein 2 isoform X2 n=1 Tax=Corythoichthys intestinalis TaxID=161448 RepID=UPI0025A4DC0C|nr:sperm flagellar protein 2 isoform X2 [Corythoichthys intestinalis]
MSDILCNWLNEEVRLSKVIEPKNFAKDFSNGYLIGEVLHKYQMLNDVSNLMKTDTSTSRLNNFTRLQPTLHRLGISFDLNTAQGLIQEKPGAATHLLYQLYVTLEKQKKKKTELMQTDVLHKKSHQVFSDRLHLVEAKRDAELKLQKVNQDLEKRRPQSIQKESEDQEDKRALHMRKFSRPKYSDVTSSQNQSADVQVPKPPPYSSMVNMRKQKHQQRKDQQAETVEAEIAEFEMNRKKLTTSGLAPSSSGLDVPLGSSTKGNGGENELTLQSSSAYIQEIRQRRQENVSASEQREKRRIRCLVEQLKAQEAQEERWREEQLVRCLTGQTQQEKRLAVQLLQMRKQKDAFRQNRLLIEQQFQQQREKEFREALEREAALTRQAQLDRAEEIQLELEFCKKMAAECARKRSNKHFENCKEILEQILDLATKVGEYRLLTTNLIPAKLMREWKELLLNGLPLYEQQRLTSPDPVELQKQELLNMQDYEEYVNMVGEWTWTEECGEPSYPVVPTLNIILRHVFLRMRSMIPLPSPSTIPGYRLKACVLGKFCSGKTTCLKKIAQDLKICVLSADSLVEAALTAYQKREVTEGEENSLATVLNTDLHNKEEKSRINLSIRAMLGRAAAENLGEGNVIPDELLVDIFVEAISQIPFESGWILDGFPFNIDQAHLLETAIASMDTGYEVVGGKIDLAINPNPPPPPPSPPALDLAVLLDIPDQCVAKRAVHHVDGGLTTTAGKSTPNSNNKLFVAQIAHRVTSFQDNWIKLEEWFGNTGRKSILTRVNADVMKDDLYMTVKNILQKAITQKQEASRWQFVEEVVVDNPLPQVSTAPPVPAAQTPSVVNDASKHEDSKSNTKSDKSSLTTSSDKASKGSADSTLDDDSQETTSSSSSPVPGSPGWFYVDEPLSLDKAEYLCQQWEAICDCYVSSVKSVMQELRLERTVIDQQLYDIREEFKHYLARPDLKQELVSQWQKDYNSIPDDLRKNEETKAELNHRLDDLREHLWDIVETHKEDDETQRAVLIREKWLEDHTAILVNHHLRLIQVEMSRFQNTRNILRDYYLCVGQQEHLDSIPLLEVEDTENAKALRELLIAKHEDALAVISKLVSIESHQVDLKTHDSDKSQEKEKIQDKERPQEKEKEKEKDNANKKSKDKKQKGSTSPPPSPSPPPAVETAEKTSVGVKNGKQKHIVKEYTAALKHEEKASHIRIRLVNGHGLVLINSLHSRAEQIFSDMRDSLEAHYVAQMKSIDQLTDVVRHFIETATKLQNELVLESIDFYFNGDLVASSPAHFSPAVSERVTTSMLTALQLDSLYHCLCNEAPTGVMSSSEFFHLIRDILPFNTLPEPWENMTENQLNEIISLLTDGYKQIDWRRFLLSAAIPWPFPSLTQLLLVRKHFKAVDTEDTGYISEEQYMQTELWFPTGCEQSISEDSYEPLYNRANNLRKFFFQLFSDHSTTPPQLDYMTMLLCFAADPDPKQGFIKALSLMTGHHLQYSSSSPLHTVTSLTDTSLGETMVLTGEKYKGEEEFSANSLLAMQTVSIPALLSVVGPEVGKMKSSTHLPSGCLSQKENIEYLMQIFAELGYTPEDVIPFSILSEHPSFHNLIENTDHHLFVNIHDVLQAPQPQEETVQSPH